MQVERKLVFCAGELNDDGIFLLMSHYTELAGSSWLWAVRGWLAEALIDT